MKRILLLFVVLFFGAVNLWAADAELAKKSTLEEILKRGELRVGFDAGYMPFEMTDKKGIMLVLILTWLRKWPRPWELNLCL